MPERTEGNCYYAKYAFSDSPVSWALGECKNPSLQNYVMNFKKGSEGLFGVIHTTFYGSKLNGVTGLSVSQSRHQNQCGLFKRGPVGPSADQPVSH
jgi:hypothetical protein